MTLKEAFSKMNETESCEQRIEAERRLIEILTFSPSSEITIMLERAVEDDWLGVPVWFRNLAYRLICLQEPDNVNIRRRAAADLLCLGPDWDLEADRLRREADEIEQK